MKKLPKGQVLLEGRIPLSWLLGVLGALVVVFIAAVIAFSAVNNISTCGDATSSSPRWRPTSSRRTIAPESVASSATRKPGVFNYFIRNLQGLTNVILYVSNTYERPLTTMVGTNNCVQCHPKSQIERDQVFNNIRVNHTGLREAGYQCVTLPRQHQPSGHAARGGPRVPEQDADLRALPRRRAAARRLQRLSRGRRPPEEINVPIKGKVTPRRVRGVPRKDRAGHLRRLP